MRKPLIIAALGLIAATLVTASSAQASECALNHGHQTFKLKTSANKHVATAGEIVRVEVRVTRHAEGRELGAVEDVEVGFALLDDSSYPVAWGRDVTDAEGLAVIKLRVTKRTPVGAFDGVAQASKELVNIVCPQKEEGFERIVRFLQILR